jgi:signal peptidase I
MQTKDLTRYLFWGFWFVLVPGLGAYLAVTQLAKFEGLGPVYEFAHGQTVPAFIAAFSLLEAACWGSRHRLPFWDPYSNAGAAGIPQAARRDYEAAEHLLEDARRTLLKNRKLIVTRLGENGTLELESTLAQLQTTVETPTFELAPFQQAYEQAQQAVTEKLAPWRKSEFREYFESIGAAILIALLLRAVVLEAFKIPSGSMLPTLQIGDHIFVLKFIYGPKVPLLNTRLWPQLPPRRGDVMVFEYPDLNPDNDRQDFIKRVIALPGDTLEVQDGHPIINGWRVPSCSAGVHAFATDGFLPRPAELEVEFLDGRAYFTLHLPDRAAHHQGPYTVKPGEVWVLGDNRDNSMDSREWQRPGGGKGSGVPYDNIKGRAFVVWLPPARFLRNVLGEPRLPDGLSPEIQAAVDRCLAQRPPLEATRPPPPTLAPVHGMTPSPTLAPAP